MLLRVQSTGGDFDQAIRRTVLHRTAPFDSDLSGGVLHFAGVDKSSVHHQPRRIRHDDVGFLSGNFHHALQVGGVLAAYLVDDKRRFAFGQMRVACHHAATQSRTVFARVIHHGACRVYVKPAVAVHRDAGGVRSLDVDLWQAVRRFQDDWTFVGRGAIIFANYAFCPE